MWNIICPDCGAALREGESCQDIFDRFLVLEFTDPAYGAVHFLTVACFMVQHGKYSDEALVWIAGKLRAYLEDGASAEEIRRIASADASNEKRTWKVNRSPGGLPLPEVTWSLTIADVERGYYDAASYRSLIERWARTVLMEMGPLLE